MKNMKQILTGATLAIAIFAIFMISCRPDPPTPIPTPTPDEPEPDPCENVVCNNGGVCMEGKCECVAFYSGSSCDHYIPVKWVGKWSCQDIVDNGFIFNYDAEIKLQASQPNIYVTNFGAYALMDSLAISLNPIDSNQAYLQGPVNFSGVDISKVKMTINKTSDTILVEYDALDSSNQFNSYNGVWIRK